MQAYVTVSLPASGDQGNDASTLGHTANHSHRIQIQKNNNGHTLLFSVVIKKPKKQNKTKQKQPRNQKQSEVSF